MILRNSNDFKKSLGIQRILRNLRILTNSTEFMELSAGGADDEVVWRRSRPTTKWSDSKSLYLAIDASSGADSFEIEKLRLSAFQLGAFC